MGLGLNARALLAVALLGCSSATLAPRGAVTSCERAPRTIAVTSDTFAVWYLQLDTNARQLYALGGPAPLDTARLPADSTLVDGYRLDAKAFPVCHDYHYAFPGDVVRLNCTPAAP